MSLDFAKNIQSLTTWVNKKKSKKKTFDYIPLIVKEEEILATKAIVESNITKKPKTTIKANITNILLKYISFY